MGCLSPYDSSMDEASKAPSMVTISERSNLARATLAPPPPYSSNSLSGLHELLRQHEVMIAWDTIMEAEARSVIL